MLFAITQDEVSEANLFDPRLQSAFHRSSWARIGGAQTVSKADLQPADDLALPTWFETPAPPKTHSAARDIQENVDVRETPASSSISCVFRSAVYFMKET